MFQVRDRASGESWTVYAVHKSGRDDEETKFLIYDRSRGWRWKWASGFLPLVEAPEPEAARRA